MKAHIGVDIESGLVHSVVGTAANVSDITQAHELVRSEDKDVFADAGYQGIDSIEQHEHLEARIRARVEHPFRVIKRQLGFVKVRYRGLAKNTAQMVTLFALGNQWMLRTQASIAGPAGMSAPAARATFPNESGNGQKGSESRRIKTSNLLLDRSPTNKSS